MLLGGGYIHTIPSEYNQGAFDNTFKYFKEHDREKFFSYTRMYPVQFDKLLKLVKPKLLKRSRRAALSPEMRLAMILKYLAHGGTYLPGLEKN